MGNRNRVFVAVAAVAIAAGPSLHAQRGRAATETAPIPRPSPPPGGDKTTETAPAGGTIQQRNVALSRSQIDTLSKQLAAKTETKGKSKFGLGLLKGDESREDAAKQLLEAEASQEAGRGRTTVVIIGNDADVTKVRESLSQVQRAVVLLFVDDSLSDTTTDNSALRGGIAGKVTGMATNMWVYLPSPGSAGTRKPNQTLSTKAATPKLWSGIFAANGELPPEAQSAVNGQGFRANSNDQGSSAPAATAAPATAAVPVASAPAAPTAAKKTGTFAEGEVLGPKIAGVKLMATPDDAGKVTATLARTDEVVVIGEEKNGYVNVQGSSASGWVKVVLVAKH